MSLCFFFFIQNRPPQWTERKLTRVTRIHDDRFPARRHRTHWSVYAMLSRGPSVVGGLGLLPSLSACPYCPSRLVTMLEVLAGRAGVWRRAIACDGDGDDDEPRKQHSKWRAGMSLSLPKPHLEKYPHCHQAPSPTTTSPCPPPAPPAQDCPASRSCVQTPSNILSLFARGGYRRGKNDGCAGYSGVTDGNKKCPYR